MARTSNIFVCVEPEIKEQAEQVLEQMGIPLSNAVSIFLRQVVLQKGMPFEVKLPRRQPLAYGSMTKKRFDAELSRGMANIQEGKIYSAQDVMDELHKGYGL